MVLISKNSCLKNTSNNNNSGQNRTKVEIIGKRLFLGIDFETVSDEAQNRTDPEKGWESTKKIHAELDPFRRCFRWSQLVVAVAQSSLEYIFEENILQFT